MFAYDNEGVEFYSRIITGASAILNPKGYLVFELGINQSSIVSDLLRDNGFCDIQIIKDLAGIDRVISGHLNN